MKGLLGGVVLLILIGIGGFLYRNAVEHRSNLEGVTACTLEAKRCPDGTFVGRAGPSCEFAPCAFPNIALADLGISFALPEGFATSTAPNAYSGAAASYVKTSTTTPSATILIYQYPIPEGQTADDVLLAQVKLEPSDLPPKDLSAFSPKIIGTTTYSKIVIERFEGTVHSAYFLPRENDVLRFDIVEQGVSDWTKPGLIPDNLSGHQALVKLLASLEEGA